MILGDTQAVVWYLAGNRRLGQRARNRMRLANLSNDAAFSAISIWEIGMLQQKGRLGNAMSATQWYEWLLAEGFNELPVTGAIAARAGDLQDIHGDPADRIVVATALEGHLLITSDRPILEWPHQLDRFDARR
ncbi:MAG: type II toxin-antitoxin system VapC family toxin [Chloroflexi bacterium]|nr:type II toxin-antitoxin system VapC family toxin [Chloroflexota bacterium]